MSSETRRLFFALWPNEALRREIAARREVLGRISRRRVPEANLHMTLVFVGDVPADAVPAVEAAGAAVHSAPFELVLDRFGWFPGARVVWLGGEAPDAGRALVASLESALDERGIGCDGRPWRPHVTLFRQVAGRPRLPEPAPLAWPAREFALVESVPGRPYQVLRTWPLE